MIVDGMPDGLYEADFFLWTQEQARLLRDCAHAATNLPLDWEHLAEEVEDLGRSNSRELRTRLRVLIEHLLKLQYSTAVAPRAGWIETVQNQRDGISDLLRKSRSLRRQVGPLAKEVAPRAAQRAQRGLRTYGETGEDVQPPSFSAEQLLTDWLPDPPAA